MTRQEIINQIQNIEEEIFEDGILMTAYYFDSLMERKTKLMEQLNEKEGK